MTTTETQEAKAIGPTLSALVDAWLLCEQREAAYKRDAQVRFGYLVKHIAKRNAP